MCNHVLLQNRVTPRSEIGHLQAVDDFTWNDPRVTALPCRTLNPAHRSQFAIVACFWCIAVILMWRCCHGPVHCLWFVTNFCDGDDNNSGDFCAYVHMKHCHWLKYFDEYSVFTLLMNMHSTVLWLEVKVSIFGHFFMEIKCMLWYCLLSGVG